MADETKQGDENRLQEARRRIADIRQACRKGLDPDIGAEALHVLREATGADTMRVYQLAENLIVEVYLGQNSDLEAALMVADAWVRTKAWAFSVSGKPTIPLAETGMYPGVEVEDPLDT